ncbi:MAG TPA: nucleotidyltransferase family protein [Elusimicrobiales bacterium]|nr:nucleotidyltransferase family protein [Elusimicrobiales bacterium]HOL62237.1 nucleotidyltransferase family protein [Elusimicrobiales bacterium]HPO94884.1 nucleotidyltransferase family protein [Elusimicrobiales bacterium]
MAQEDRYKIKIKNVLILSELKKLDELLFKKNIDVILFKGASLILKGYFGLDEREMSDADLIVKEKDFLAVEEAVKLLGFKKIPKGRHSYYKIVGEKFAPVILDIHVYFSNFKFEDFICEETKEYRKIKILDDSDTLIILAIHPIIKHGFFSEKDKKDLVSVYYKAKINNQGIDLEISNRTQQYGVSLIVSMSFEKCGIDFKKTKIGFKERLSYPFVKMCFYKHFKLNEYILPFFYEFGKIKEKLSS